MKAAVISEQGMRPDMEDAHFLDTDFGGKGWVFAGAYDGHGGSFAAGYAAGRLHGVFLDKLLAGASPRQAFIQSYETVSDELKNQNSGTTAVNFFMRDGTIYTANVGDARAIVVGRGNPPAHLGTRSQVPFSRRPGEGEVVLEKGASPASPEVPSPSPFKERGTKGVRSTGNIRVRQLTVDHRLDNPEERRRVEKAGGRIEYPYTYRGYSGLMPTRTLGDEYFKPVGIIATPSVGEYRVTPGDFMLIAACDGLFDFMSNDEVAEFAVRFPEPQRLLEELRREVLVNRTGSDNLTVVAVKLTELG